MKKIKNILLWFFLAAYLVVILGFVAEGRKHIICNKVEIVVENEEMNRFLKQEDIKKAIDHFKIRQLGVPIDSVDTYLAEKIVDKNPAVRSSAAYTTIDGKFLIEVEQRKPILRVVDKKLLNYYIDNTGQIIPVTGQSASLTLLANGNINEPFEVISGKNIFPSNKDSILRPNVIYELFSLAKYIDKDDFWRSQIEQIYVDSHGEMQLVPRVGSQIIIFGHSDDLDNKFKKLKSLYRAFNQIGWNQYKTINLKYKDQIVCTKR